MKSAYFRQRREKELVTLQHIHRFNSVAFSNNKLSGSPQNPSTLYAVKAPLSGH